MSSLDGVKIYDLIYVIVNHGMGTKVLRQAKTCGVSGGTILLGKGTIINPFLNFLSLYDEKKEVVLMIANREIAGNTLNKLNKKFKFDRPHHGIAFTTSTVEVIGSRSSILKQGKSQVVDQPLYQIIVTIVDRGKADDVVEAAKSAGSRGGTIINARGSGVDETTKLFNMEIEPEKEMVIILAKNDSTESIISSISEKLKINKPGNGIIYTQNALNVYGIY
ncbi:MAG: P-II family nitrogen regulator [Alkalibacterium sp.]|nr:P-II family nitrogen regulator [Alkalibacterium sp.]